MNSIAPPHMTPATNGLTPKQYALNQSVWGIIACCAALDCIWMAALGIGTDFSGIAPFFIALAVCITLSLVYGRIRKDPAIWLLSQVAMQLMVCTPVLGALSYLAARTALPLIDEQLIAIDQALGFDWKGYIAWVNRRPLLADILSLSYTSAGPQMLLVLMALFFTKQTLHIQRFTLLFVVGSLLTIILANLLPAVAGYIHYDIDIAAYPNLHPAAERAHEAVIFGMRDHSMNVFSFPVKGIVTFPSFHSTIAILLIYACWPLPLLRYISMPLNLLVLMSTPVDGGHYLIDVIGGVAIAFAGIWWAQKKIHA